MNSEEQGTERWTLGSNRKRRRHCSKGSRRGQREAASQSAGQGEAAGPAVLWVLLSAQKAIRKVQETDVPLLRRSAEAASALFLI